jgi:hypothetical protein
MNVRTGEEIMLDGNQYLKNNIASDGFDWDFGDSYRAFYPDNGVSVTHTFQYPGLYPVTLYMNDSSKGRITSSVTISVTGLPHKIDIISLLDPLVKIKFDSSLTDSSKNSLPVSYSGTPKYVVGTADKGLDLNGAFVKVDNTAQFSNMEKLTVSVNARRKNLASQGMIFDAGNIKLYYSGEWKITLSLKTTNGECIVNSNWETLSHNTNWNNYAVVYDGSKLHLYINGKEPVAAASCTGRVSLGDKVMLGADQAGGQIFNIELDEFGIVNRAIPINDIQYGFELQHADFHARTGQYIYANIPSELITYSAKRLYVRLFSQEGYNKVIYDKTGIQPKEKIFLNNSALPAGHYTLAAQLIDSSGKVITEVDEFFEKDYNGIPEVGINENNAIVVNGKLFFPVTPWGLNEEVFTQWINNDKAINCLYGTGWWITGGYGATHNLESWKYYLSKVKPYNMKTIGPANWDDGYDRTKSHLTDIDLLMQYIEQTKNENILAWQWQDEPDLKGASPSIIRSWTYASHMKDPQHLVATNLVGWNWAFTGGWHEDFRKKYEYLYDAQYFGGEKTLVADIIGFDFYPIEWASPHTKDAKMTQLADIIDKIRQENGDMAPIFSWIETSDIYESPYPNPYPPTPEQVTMLTWLNVIHGVKGIDWFHHRKPTPPENFVAMNKFLVQITDLTPVVLGPEVTRTVTNNAASKGGRVDTMVREYNNNVYVFAVRVTEVTETTKPPITVTFNVEGIGNAKATVYDEARQLDVVSGAFTDTFSPNAVHIYKIS